MPSAREFMSKLHSLQYYTSLLREDAQRQEELIAEMALDLAVQSNDRTVERLATEIWRKQPAEERAEFLRTSAEARMGSVSWVD